MSKSHQQRKTQSSKAEPKVFKSGFIAMLGRPNAGKSTLTNRLVGEKVAIVSDKPQTTRNSIRGVYTDEGMQAVLSIPPAYTSPNSSWASG